MRICLLILILILSNKESVWAATDGRLTVGGFISREDHSGGIDDTTRNDFAVASARIFMRSTQVASKYDEFVFDLRDKNDFFNIVDKERLELTNNNELQLRQAAYSYKPKGRGGYSTFGRFPVPEAGSAYTDGLELGYHWNSKFKSALFGGYNPRRADRSYLVFSDKAQIYGAYIDFVSKSQYWYQRFNMTNAFAQETFEAQLDRSYWFHNSVYQWNERSLISALFYLDFVPRTYVQNSSLNYSQGLTKKFTSQLTVSTVDAIQYRRIQDVRERLEPSAYQEAKIALKQKYGETNNWILSYRHGERDFDHLTREITTLGFNFPQNFSKRIDFFAEGSLKKEFTKEGSFAKLGTGYFTDVWDYTLEVEGGVEKQTDGTTLHPVIAEFAAGLQISKRLFSVFSAQVAHDEQVDILTLFAKMTYRFGGKELAPIRDGAPPRGRL